MSVFSNTSKDAPELRSQYAAAVLGLVGDLSAIDVLRETPGAAARAVAALTPEKLRTPEVEGKWSIAQVLRHLADTDIVWGWRMRLILAQDRPTITGFDQDLWAERLDYALAGGLGACRRARRAWRRERRLHVASLRRPRLDAPGADRSHRQGDRVTDLSH